MSETFLSSKLKKNPCTQAGANVTPAYIDILIDFDLTKIMYLY